MDIIQPGVVVYVAYANGSGNMRMSRKHVTFYCLQLQHQHCTVFLSSDFQYANANILSITFRLMSP